MTLEDFNYQTITLPNDYEGAVIATLITAKGNKAGRGAVLYLHGFSDYFFHPHMTEAFLNAGFNFYALELRKYGHSLLPHQHVHYCKNMKEYFEEIDYAMEHIAHESETIALIGHSTGGLLASLYAQKGVYKSRINRVVLNSPFLEFYKPILQRKLGKLIAGPLSKIFPYSAVKEALSPHYTKSVHKDFNGIWDFNLEWKPVSGVPAYYAWIHAIDKAQKETRKHELSVPVLILCSEESGSPKKYSDEKDIVLNVKHMHEYGKLLSSRVILKTYKGAVHDIFLSKKEIRDKALTDTINWIK